jgi:dethiobiotin synthetase
VTRFVVVAGTDTGVGKTLVTAGLAAVLLRNGRRTIAIKPVETGCSNGARDREDGAILAAATGQATPREALVRLRDPLTPALAAEREGVALDTDALVARARELAAGADVVLVEGAGGLLSPITWTTDITSVAHGLDATVLLVGADRLGTINHVHMAVQVLLDTRLLPAGIVLSAPETPDPSTGTNAAALRRRLASYGGVHERIAELHRVATPEGAAAHLAAAARWISE